MLFHTKARVVDAIQFTGVESVAAIQAWMHPQSPLFGPASRSGTLTLSLMLRDRVQDTQYPSLIPNYTMKQLGIGGWIIRDNEGELAVMTNEEFTDRYEALPPAPGDDVAAVDVASEPVFVPEGSVPGDDVDPTGVVDTSHVQARAAALAPVDDPDQAF